MQPPIQQLIEEIKAKKSFGGTEREWDWIINMKPLEREML